MKIKSIFSSAFLYVVYYYAVSALSVVIALVPIYIVRALIYDEYIRTLTTVISLIMVTLIGLFMLFYKDGQKKNVSYDNDKIFIKFIISVICSYIICYLIGILTKFFIIIYMPSNYLSILITAEADISIVQNKYFGTLNITFLILLIPMFISSLLGFKKGVVKREKNRTKTITKDKE